MKSDEIGGTPYRKATTRIRVKQENRTTAISVSDSPADCVDGKGPCVGSFEQPLSKVIDGISSIMSAAKSAVQWMTGSSRFIQYY